MKPTVFFSLTLLWCLNASAQTKANLFYNYAFSRDSLKGFDEPAAIKASVDEQFLGEELDVHLYHLKRRFVNNKYNLQARHAGKAQSLPLYAGKTATVANCLNLDFESATAGTVTTFTQVAGWMIARGSHTNASPPGNSCNLNGFNNSLPEESAVFIAPNGYVDPNIGPVYPVYSVFGNSAGDPGAESYNPQVGQLRGDNFFRLNSDELGNRAYSIEKLSRTFLITPGSSFFQFAFLSVFSSGHSCCDAGAFQLKLYNSSNNLLTCPAFSVSPLSTACNNTVSGTVFYNAYSGTPATTNSSNYIFNKWQVVSFDLSTYMGQSIQFEFTASDCTAGGHYGYTYFDMDCQAGPQSDSISVSGTSLPIQNDTTLVIGTCVNSLSLAAPNGYNAYLWKLPSTSTSTNSSINVSASGIYTLQLIRQSTACSPSYSKTVYLDISFNPLVLTASVTNTIICLGETVTVTGLGAQNYTWSTGATSNSIAVSPTVNTNYILTGFNYPSCKDSINVYVQIDLCTGLGSPSAENKQLSIFPNPTSGMFTISAPNLRDTGTFVLLSPLGQLVCSVALTPGRNDIKIPGLKPGIYYYVLKAGEKELNKGKLLIE